MWLVLLKWTQLHCTATTLSCDEARGGFVHGVPWTLRPVHTECPGPAISRLHPSWQELAQERAKSGCGSPGALSAACPTSAHHSPPLPPNCPNLKTLPGKCPSRNKPTHRTTKLHKVAMNCVQNDQLRLIEWRLEGSHIKQSQSKFSVPNVG